MTITIELPPEVEESVLTQAAKDGSPVGDYVTTLIKEGVKRRAEVDRLAALPFDELLAPVRKEFKESGMTELELDTLVEEVREEIWQEKKSRGGIDIH